MNRTAALAYLAGVLAQQLTESGLTATDDAANLGPAIDDALLTLGTAYADLATATVASANVRGYRVLLRYFGLQRIYAAVLHRVNISGGNPNASKSAGDYPKQIAAELARLAKEAAVYGLSTGPTWMPATTITTDYLEPAEVGT